MPYGKPAHVWDWNYQVYSVTKSGDIIETVALADNFAVAEAAFEAAVQARAGTRLEMRFKARVMKQADTSEPQQ